MNRVYVKGYVGNLGTKILIEEKYNELSKHFNIEFLNYVKDNIYDFCEIEDGVNPSSTICDKNVIDIEEVGKGGVLSALWKICDRNKWGLKYSLRDIPIMQGTVEVANFFDINPYRLLTKNAYVIVCSDESMSDYANNELTCIGEITSEKKRVRIDSEVESFLTKDYKDEIDKIIPGYTKKNKC